MNRYKILKLIHLVSAIWFVVCMIFLVVAALHQAGFNWWVIFSLSGHSVLLTFLLVSLYLFAIFGASGKEQRIGVEHPLTSTGFYMGFYVSAPLLGAAGGVLAILEIPEIGQLLSLMALGTFAATFLTWVIVDPVISVIEMLSPAAGAHRRERIATNKAQHEQRQHDRERMLEQVLRQHTALDLCSANRQNAVVWDYVTSWWDGIGNWRTPAIG
jgi:hypothetical protein